VPTPSPIPVVCAVIEDDSRGVLLARRPPHKHLADKWEFPGGKVDPGETALAALHRELREELGCEVVVVEELPRFNHDYGSVIITMIPFRCTLAPGSPAPTPHEHTALAWARRDALRHFDLAPADWPVVDALGH
jgi:8-oxo-dGTP diphosphatase